GRPGPQGQYRPGWRQRHAGGRMGAAGARWANPPDSPAVDDGRGSVFRSEEFCLDEVDEPVLPLRFGPAGADDQELKRAAVDEGEEGVDGVAAVDPGAEPPAFQEQIDQAFLGPVAPLMVLAQKVSGGRFGGRRVA